MIGLSHSPMNRYIPGLNEAFEKNGFEYIIVDDASSLNSLLPEETSLVLIGAVHEICAIELFIWAKQKLIPVAAIEEVAQLSLNNSEVYNYNLPFDRLFVASRKEYELFRSLGHPAESIRISGLLPGISPRSIRETCMREEAAPKIGIPDDKPLLIYTTSPIRHRLAIHSKDDLAFRIAILKQINYGNKARRWRIVVKLHPNEDVDRERARIQEIIPDAIVLGREVQISELLALASLVVNRGNSQTALEAALTGCPLLVVACGLKTIFHEDGGAFVAEDATEIPALMRRVEAGEKPDTRQLKENEFYEPDAGAAHFIANGLKDIADVKLPLSPEGWEWVAKTLLFHGIFHIAKELSRQAPSGTRLMKAIEEAVAMELGGDYQGASRSWKHCSELDPNWFFPYYQMSHMYLAIRDYNAAITASKMAIALHPPYYREWHDIPMRIIQSSSYRMMNKVELAHKCLAPLMESDPSTMLPELTVEFGFVYISLGMIDEAMGMVSHTINILDQHSFNKIIDSIMWHRITLLFYAICNSIPIKYLNNTLSLNPNNSTTYLDWIFNIIHCDNINFISALRKMNAHTTKSNNKTEYIIALMLLFYNIESVHLNNIINICNKYKLLYLITLITIKNINNHIANLNYSMVASLAVRYISSIRYILIKSKFINII